MIKNGIVYVEGKEYVLWATEDDYKYGDLETAVHATPKKDFDELMEKYEDADCYIYPFNIFMVNKKDFEERIKEWYEDDME